MEKVSNICKSKASRDGWKPGDSQVAEWFQEKPHQTKRSSVGRKSTVNRTGYRGNFLPYL